MQERSRFTYSIFPYTPEYEFYLTTARYSMNNRVVLQMYMFDSEDCYYTPYATLTVNIPDATLTNPNCVYLDTNNCPWALDLLVDKLKVAKPTHKLAFSGWCHYPEVELNSDELYKYIPYKGEIANDNHSK